MRSAALLLVLIAAFYVLLSDNKKPGGSGKVTSPQETSEESVFAEGLPDDFMSADITRFGSLEKLKDDLEYRRLKMDHALEAEMRDFKNSHDKNGKDKEAYETLVKKQNDVRTEFNEKYVGQIKEYKKMKAEMYESNDKGLR